MGKSIPQEPSQRKIGHKTKYAEDTAHKDVKRGEQLTSTTSKDKKKRRKSSDQVDGEIEATTRKKLRKSEKTVDQGADKEVPTKKPKEKGVSLKTGTKNRAGDESDSDADDSSETVTAADNSEQKSKDKTIEDMKRRKREKKKERKILAKNGTLASNTTQNHETPILSYLSRYYRDRASWKFQKNRETNLLKHLYSLEHVPAQYNAALLTYLQGLRGDAAKQRLSEGAVEAVKSTLEDKITDTADNEYQQAVDMFRAALPVGGDGLNGDVYDGSLAADAKKRLFKRQRAELVFYAVNADLISAEKIAPKPNPAVEGRSQNKKRKNRTAIVDISSSSESESTSSSGSDSEASSSDSDSDTDEDESPALKTESGPHKSKSVSSESSSESTSSSSDEGESGDDASSSQARTSTARKSDMPTSKHKPVDSSLKKHVVQSPKKPVPSKSKKKQKRKIRTAQIEISSSESES